MKKDGDKRCIITDDMSVGELNTILGAEKEREYTAREKLNLYIQSVKEIEERINYLKSQPDYKPTKVANTPDYEKLLENDYVKNEILKLFKIEEDIENLPFDKVDRLLQDILNAKGHIRVIIYLNRRSQGVSAKLIAKELDISSGRLYQLINSFRKEVKHPRSREKFIKLLGEK